MADPKDKFSDNIIGAWYVDTTCIGCGQCDDSAPAIFRRSEAYDNNYVHHQPDTEEEFQLAERARESCPVEAIGNDG